MLFKDTVNLIQISVGKDADGFAKNQETIRDGLFVNKKDVRSSEFYQAAAQGIRLETMFVMRSMDYEGEKILSHEGNKYAIERTYDRGEMVELVCQSRDDNHGS